MTNRAMSKGVAAVILAAGLSTRMGANKLLADVKGKPLIRHTVDATIASTARPVVVVTGPEAGKIADELRGCDVRLVHNSDYSKGLSTSLITGIRALPPDSSGALVLLGDMPDISVRLIDRMIATFDPALGATIVVATRGGRRGNPVLWARRYFPEILTLQGDVGARNLIDAHPEAVVEVEAEDDAPLIDIDTPEMLQAYRTR
jgi:molybdenum cofactor cytidylyltransferase